MEREGLIVLLCVNGFKAFTQSKRKGKLRY